MRFLTHKIFCLLAGVFLLACESDVDKVIFEGGTSPVLTVSSTDDIVLAKSQEDFHSLQFSWTNPDYQFSNGANTQDVTYTLEIDTAGSDFSNPKSVAMNFTRDLSTNFSVKSLNTALSGLELKDDVPHNFEFRVKATLPGNAVPVYSNVVAVTITTYLDVIYPVPDNLYITGSATPASWQAGVSGEAVPPNQQFTKVNAYTFQIDKLHLTFNGTADDSNGFLLIPVYGSWSAKYGFTGAKHQNNGNGDSFIPEGTDFAPPPTGDYKIVVNFKTGKYSVEAVEE